MKTFKNYLSESSSTPVIACGIGRRKTIHEAFWDSATPLTKEHEEDKTKIPVIDSDVVKSYMKEMRRSIIPHLEASHYPYLDENTEYLQNLHEYVMGSQVLNKTLKAAHDLKLNPDNEDHFYHAMQHAFDSGEVDKADYHNIDWHKKHNYFKHYQHLKHLTENAPELPVSFHTYTGVGARFDVHKLRNQDGGRIHLPAFTSTSLDPSSATSFASKTEMHGNITTPVKRHRELIRLTMQQGKQYGLFHGNNYEFPQGTEDEFILRPKTTIRLVNEPRILHRRNSTFLIHDAEIEDYK